MKLLSKQLPDINPGDTVVNLGQVKRMEEYSNGYMLTYEDNTIKFYRRSQSLVVEVPNAFDKLFKAP